MSKVRYDRFGDRLFHWSSVGEFIADSGWRDGIHAITYAPGQHFDVLLRGDVTRSSDSRSLPIFFSGAVQRDGTFPPFFSGTTLARHADVPIVSIADPTLNLSDGLSIGWYTGGGEGRFQHALPQFLVSIKAAVQKEVMLVGGSAGGFASLYYASISGCGAFVWNPQTDLLRYGAWAVRDYLVTVLEDQSWAYDVELAKPTVEPVDLDLARHQLSASGIESIVGSAASIPKLIYLQNESDHHLQRHAEPYRVDNAFNTMAKGIYVSGERVMSVSHFAEGHRAPRRDVIERGLELALSPDRDLLAGVRGLMDR